MACLRRCQAEEGTGTIATSAGTAVFLVFMLFAVQLTMSLYATSTVNAAGYDAARTVASKAVDHEDPVAVRRATRRAEGGLRQLLGDLGRDAQLSWSIDGGSVRLRVRATTPGILPSGLADTAGLRSIDRTFVVRIESVG